MNVVFLSNFYPRCKRDYYLSRSKSGLSAAADAHQYAIAQGLYSACGRIQIINLPSIFPFPHRNKDLFVMDEELQENGLFIHNVGSCNLAFYQYISRYHHSKAALKKAVEGCADITYILVYATNLAFLRAATEMRNKYKNVRICLIVPDLPDDMESNKYAGIRRRISNVFFKSYDEYMSQFDSYVLLTESMADRIGCKEGTYIVNEGVYDEGDSSRSISLLQNEDFTIFYSGMMYRKFGVMNLVDAVHRMKNEKVKLVLCGYGESVDEIKTLSKTDKRIEYLGIISRDEALNYQSKADLLVNPRVPDQNPFTKFSFPSKNLEYLASGTPTLLYQLEGIPSEYYDYCYFLDKDHTDVESLQMKIEEIMNVPFEERKKRAMKARDFVLNNKNAKKTGEAIIELLKTNI